MEVSQNRMTRYLWLLVFVAFTFYLWMQLSHRIAFQNHIDDLFWMMPYVAKHLDGASLSQSLGFVFSSQTEMGAPSLNIAMLVFYKCFGHFAAGPIFVTFTLHVLLCVLLFTFVSRWSGMGENIAWGVALVFLCFYPHFHSYVWAVAIQHQIVLLFSFVVLDRFMDLSTSTTFSCANWLSWLAICFLASFARESILALPVGLFLLVFFSSNSLTNFRERLVWAGPGILLLVGYRCVEIVRMTWGWQVENFAGNRAGGMWHWLKNLRVWTGDYFEAHFGSRLMGALFASLILWSILSGLGLLFWLLIRKIERSRGASIANRLFQPRVKWRLATLICVGAVTFVFWGFWRLGFKELMSIFSSVLFPTKNVFNHLTFMRWQMMDFLPRLRPNAFISVFLCFASLLALVQQFRRQRYWFLVLFLQSLMIFGYLKEMQKTHIGVSVPSRYALYLTPLVVVSIGYLVWEIWNYFSPRLSAFMRRFAVGMALLLLFCCLVMNIVAIERRVRVTTLSDAAGLFPAIFSMQMGDLARQFLDRQPEPLNRPLRIYADSRVLDYHIAVFTEFFPGEIFPDDSPFHPVAFGIQSELIPPRYSRAIRVELTSDRKAADLNICGSTWCDQNQEPIDESERRVSHAEKMMARHDYLDAFRELTPVLKREPFVLRMVLEPGQSYSDFLYNVSGDNMMVHFPSYLSLRTPKYLVVRKMIAYGLVTRGKVLLYNCYLKEKLGQGLCSRSVYEDIRRLGLNNETWKREDFAFGRPSEAKEVMAFAVEKTAPIPADYLE